MKKKHEFVALSLQEKMNVNGVEGGRVTVGSLLISMGLGAMKGSIDGAIWGSAVPGGGTVAGALSGFVIGAGTGALAHVIQDYGATKVDEWIN